MKTVEGFCEPYSVRVRVEGTPGFLPGNVDAERLAELVNRHGRIVRAERRGYVAELPEEAVTAVRFLSLMEMLWKDYREEYKKSMELVERAMRLEFDDPRFHTIVEGITLLSWRRMAKYTAMLVRGELTRDRLAKALYSSALARRCAEGWRPILKWLEKNGYRNLSGKLLVRKTLIDG